MLVNKKITILIIILFIALASLFVYKKLIPLLNKKPAGLSVPASVEEIRKQEFTEALKQASASDQDMDGISNNDEVSKYKTDPTSVDTDNDGLTDWQEVFTFKTDPLKADTDNDGLNDGYEVRHGSSPIKK